MNKTDGKKAIFFLHVAIIIFHNILIIFLTFIKISGGFFNTALIYFFSELWKPYLVFT